MKVICVDDEKLVLDYTLGLCRDLPQIDEAEGFNAAADALVWLETHTADIALLDIVGAAGALYCVVLGVKFAKTENLDGQVFELEQYKSDEDNKVLQIEGGSVQTQSGGTSLGTYHLADAALDAAIAPLLSGLLADALEAGAKRVPEAAEEEEAELTLEQVRELSDLEKRDLEELAQWTMPDLPVMEAAPDAGP